MINKKVQMGLMFFVVLFLIVLGVIFIPKVQQATVGGSQVQIIARPVFGFLSCEQRGNSVITNFVDLPVEGKTFSDSSFGDTDGFVITIKTPDFGFFSDSKRIRYKICQDGSCEEDFKRANLFKDDDIFDLPKVSKQQTVFVKLEDLKLGGSWGDYTKGKAQWKASFTPYGLWATNVFAGKGEVSNTCGNPSSTLDSLQSQGKILGDWVIKSTTPKASGTSVVSRLPIGSTINFLAGYVDSPYDVQTYAGKEVYCVPNYEGAKAGLFTFNTLQTKERSYKIADLNNNVATVECCNGQILLGKVCAGNKYVDESQAKPDFAGNCAISQFQIDLEDTSYKTVYRTVNEGGKCIKEKQTVECANSLACSTGFQCTNFKCVKTGTEDLGVGSDTKTSCENRGGTWITKKTDYCEGLFCSLTGIGKKSSEETFCKETGFVDYLPYILFGIIFLVVIYLLTSSKKKRGG